MPRYIINVSSNGHRLFSTSRSTIGMDKSKLSRLVNLFDILVAGAPDDEDMSMEVVLIGDATATTCMLNGDPLPVASPSTTLADLGDIDSHDGRDGYTVGDPALSEHPIAKANAESWNFTKGGIVKP